MLSWIIQISLISIIFIFLAHNIFCFLKNTLTIPKVHDLVNNSSKKYENIYSIILNDANIRKNKDKTNHSDSYSDSDLHLSYTEIDLLPMNNTNTNSITESNMKNELKSFLKSQLNVSGNENSNYNSNEVVEYENSSLLSENFSYL